MRSSRAFLPTYPATLIVFLPPIHTITRQNSKPFFNTPAANPPGYPAYIQWLKNLSGRTQILVTVVEVTRELIRRATGFQRARRQTRLTEPRPRGSGCRCEAARQYRVSLTNRASQGPPQYPASPAKEEPRIATSPPRQIPAGSISKWRRCPVSRDRKELFSDRGSQTTRHSANAPLSRKFGLYLVADLPHERADLIIGNQSRVIALPDRLEAFPGGGAQLFAFGLLTLLSLSGSSFSTTSFFSRPCAAAFGLQHYSQLI